MRYGRRIATFNVERRRFAQVTAFHSNEDRLYFCAKGLVPEGRDVLVPGSGVDVEAFSAECQDQSASASLRQAMAVNGRLVVTMVARLVREKGVMEYLQAAHREADTRQRPVSARRTACFGGQDGHSALSA